MRFIFTGGGTGGHVYPSLAVAQALRESAPADEIWYAGRSEGIEQALASDVGLPYLAISAAPVRGESVLRLGRSLVDLVQGTYAAWRTMKRTRPDAIFATGGFVSVPVVVAGWLRGIPSLVYLPDLEPGLAVKALARIAKRIAVTTEEATGFFQPRKVFVSGYPVRSAFGSLSRDDARKRLGLGDGKVVLVFGGSRGAHAINVAVQGVLESLLGLCELVHVCGQEDFAALSETRDRLAQPIQARYHLHAYLHDEMPAAIKAADLVVSRSGASVLGEFTAAGVPSVLVPYPYAGEHQRKNAAYLQERRAAVVIGNGDLNSALLPTVRALLADESRLRNMKECAARLGRPDAAARLASLLRLLPSEKAT